MAVACCGRALSKQWARAMPVANLSPPVDILLFARRRRPSSTATCSFGILLPNNQECEHIEAGEHSNSNAKIGGQIVLKELCIPFLEVLLTGGFNWLVSFGLRV